MIERIALSQGGRVTSVDPATNTIVTDFGNYTAQVANVIPPHKAGRIAEIAGAADRTGWCPIDPVTFASTLVPNVHVIGDACFGGSIPKSASAAQAQAKACAAAIVSMLSGNTPETPRLTGACYNIVAPGYGVFAARRLSAEGRPVRGSGGRATSPVDAPREIRAREAEGARALVQDHHGGRVWLELRISMLGAAWLLLLALPRRARESLQPYKVVGDSIPDPLTATRGDAARGRALVVDRSSTCILCHSGPFPEQKFQGDLAPDLAGSGSRWSEGQLRLRLVDAARLNAATIMPSYYRIDGLVRVGANWRGKPILSAEQIEDILAYLVTLTRIGSDSRCSNPAPSTLESRRQRRRARRRPELIVRPAEATPAMLATAIRNVVGEAAIRTGKVKLDIPPLVENGNTVPMTVSVASPMTADDYVKSIHVFNEKNPQPNIGNFYLGPHAGRAQISTRIRLADSQKVVAIARLSDDTFWPASRDVVVTLAACTEEVI